MENKEYKIYWDFMIQCDRMIEAGNLTLCYLRKGQKM